MLARHMSSMPEVAIFRRFGEEAVLDLLYRQAELTSLSNRLQKLQHSDSQGRSRDKDCYYYAVDWEYLLKSSESGDGEQFKLVQEISLKVKEYRES
jgi:hypothetical protein